MSAERICPVCGSSRVNVSQHQTMQGKVMLLELRCRDCRAGFELPDPITVLVDLAMEAWRAKAKEVTP